MRYEEKFTNTVNINEILVIQINVSKCTDTFFEYPMYKR